MFILNRHSASCYNECVFTAVYPIKKQIKQILIDIEAQYDFNPGYSLISRAVFYGSRMISSQYGRDFTKSDYGNLKKACSIWVCLDPPKRLRNHILEYNLHPSFRLGRPCRPSGNHDLFSVVMICLGDYEAAECTGVLRLLSILFLSNETVDKKKSLLEREFHIPMTAELGKKVIDVCNFSDYIEQRGIKKGRKEGRKEGSDLSLLSSICNVMESLNISVEQAMEILKIPADRRLSFAQAIQKRFR